MESRKHSFKERTRDFFLRFIEDFDLDEQRRMQMIHDQIEKSLKEHSYTILQIDNDNHDIETLSGWIVRVEQDQQRIVLKATNEKQFHLLDFNQIRKVSLRKR